MTVFPVFRGAERERAEFARPVGNRSAPLPVLWRAVAALAEFPVTFRSALDGAPFWAGATFLAFYAIAPEIGGLAFYVKYLFAASLVICCTFLIFARQRFCMSPVFTVGPFILFVVGIFTFGYTSLKGGGNTFSSALIPLLIVAAPMFVPADNSRTDSKRALRYLLLIFGTAASFHVFWQLVGKRLGIDEPLDNASAALLAPRYAASSGVILYFMILAGLFRKKMMLNFAICLAVLSLVLRPSSTLAFCLAFAVGGIAVHRLGFRRLFRIANCSLVAAIIISNLAILASDKVTRLIYSVEPFVKTGILDSESNNDFRIGIIAAARAEMAESSIWIGHAFSGGIDVSVTRYLPWYDGIEAPIHSDFLTITVQGGLFGMALFASIFVGLAGLCWRGVQLARAAGDADGELLFDAILAICLVFMLYVSFNPMMPILECVLPFLMVVPLAIFLARSIPGFTRKA